MKSDYEERKQRRIERYSELARKNSEESTRKFEQAHAIGSMIPMGQPILVGHHSERRHRRDIEKIDNAMRSSVEASKKSEYYSNKAESAEESTAISSDDPNALEKLQAKLEKLTKFQEIGKQVNKILRGKKPEAEKADLIIALGFTQEQTFKMMDREQFGGMGLPSYSLRNNLATIKNVQKRIAHLEKLNQAQDAEKVIGDVRIFHNATENRVQIFFPGKPADEVRTKLKRSGFRWSPTAGAWQAYYSNRAKYYADEIVKAL